MDKTYGDYLQRQLDEAQERFEAAKAEAIKDIQSMNFFNAADFGAAYFTHIDHITQAGTKVQAIGQALQAYDYMMAEKVK